MAIDGTGVLIEVLQSALAPIYSAFVLRKRRNQLFNETEVCIHHALEAAAQQGNEGSIWLAATFSLTGLCDGFDWESCQGWQGGFRVDNVSTTMSP